MKIFEVIEKLHKEVNEGKNITNKELSLAYIELLPLKFYIDSQKCKKWIRKGLNRF